MVDIIKKFFIKEDIENNEPLTGNGPILNQQDKRVIKMHLISLLIGSFLHPSIVCFIIIVYMILEYDTKFARNLLNLLSKKE
jgi:hypothetical protein